MFCSKCGGCNDINVHFSICVDLGRLTIEAYHLSGFCHQGTMSKHVIEYVGCHAINQRSESLLLVLSRFEL